MDDCSRLLQDLEAKQAAKNETEDGLRLEIKELNERLDEQTASLIH